MLQRNSTRLFALAALAFGSTPAFASEAELHIPELDIAFNVFGGVLTGHRTGEAQRARPTFGRRHIGLGTRLGYIPRRFARPRWVGILVIVHVFVGVGAVLDLPALLAAALAPLGRGQRRGRNDYCR